MAAVMAEVGPRFEAATGHRIEARFSPTGAIQRLIESGAPFDLAIVDRPVIETLIKQGRVADKSRIEFARDGLGVGMRAGVPKPDINSVDAFRRVMLNAKRIAYAAEGAVGIHLPGVFDRLGIVEQIKAKTSSQPTAARAAEAVAKGEAELGLGLASILLSVPGVELVGLFPPELQYHVVLTLGLSASAQQPDAAKALIQYLTSKEVAEFLEARRWQPLFR
jgi:molybdate transport system substrate-binding protein